MNSTSTFTSLATVCTRAPFARTLLPSLTLLWLAACGSAAETDASAIPPRTTTAPAGSTNANAPGSTPAGAGGASSTSEAPSGPSVLGLNPENPGNGGSPSGANSNNGQNKENTTPAAADEPGKTEPNGGDPSTGESATDPTGEPTEPAGDPTGEPVDPRDDEDIRFVEENGYQTIYTAVHCRSVAEDGSSIDESEVAELPVGDGRVLECETALFPLQSTIEFLSSIGERWCALGELESYTTGGDERLDIAVVTEPGPGPATLIGSHEGEAITVKVATGFGGATLWPLWIDTIYSVVDVQRAVPGKLCDEVMGIE
jgi:hypothetical protein